MYLEYYKEKLGIKDIPTFLVKYLSAPSLCRLKHITYFCAMDYASKDIYDFKEKITRYDHSVTTALNVWRLTNNKVQTIAALFHDVSTPCGSHVIDYMNRDYEKQESTEKHSETILKNDKYLLKCLKKDNIDIDDIINFKKYSIVDNDRPKLCADRLDGIILTSISWTKEIEKEDINSIVEDLTISKNEDNEQEISFKTIEIAKKVLKLSDLIDEYCHTDEDNYMMNLLSNIIKYSIEKKYIKYEDLYKIVEEDLFRILNKKKDSYLADQLYSFRNMKWEEIPNLKYPNVKKRVLNPLVNGKRLK